MINKKECYLGVDLGATSGKMAAAHFDGEVLHMDEIHSFPNRPVRMPSALYWDVFGCHNSIIDGFAKIAASGCRAKSVGIDTFGASYGLLDRKGRLAEPVYHYLDRRTEGTCLEEMYRIIPAESIFYRTGCQCNRTYTLPHLFASVREGDGALANAAKLLLMPDLLGYFLCGEAVSEVTIAGTSSLLNVSSSEWAYSTAERLAIPAHVLTPLVQPGTVKGFLTDYIAEETRIGVPRIAATAGHDSAAALLALPGFGPGKLYISAGTAVNMGIERDLPVMDEASYARGIKNISGACGKTIVCQDFPAMWMLEELLRSFAAAGVFYSYAQLQTMAEATVSPGVFLDVEYPPFRSAEGDIRRKMADYLHNTDQQAPADDGAWVRCVLESIALKIAWAAKQLQAASGAALNEAYLVSGGARSTLLVQLISNATGLPVKTGMPHATLYGNILGQLLADGQASDITQIREIAARSVTLRETFPEKGDGSALFDKYRIIMNCEL